MKAFFIALWRSLPHILVLIILGIAIWIGIQYANSLKPAAAANGANSSGVIPPNLPDAGKLPNVTTVPNAELEAAKKKANEAEKRAIAAFAEIEAMKAERQAQMAPPPAPAAGQQSLPPQQDAPPRPPQGPQGSQGQAPQNFLGTVTIEYRAKSGLDGSIIGPWEKAAKNAAMTMKLQGLSQKQIDKAVTESAQQSGLGDRATARAVFSDNQVEDRIIVEMRATQQKRR